MIYMPASNENIEDIVHEYSSMIYRLAVSQTKNADDANDVMQDVLIRYFKSGIAFESKEHRKAWLIRVTINCCRTLLSSAWFRRTTSLDENQYFETNDGDEGEVYREVVKLPVKYRTVIHLFYYEDMAIAEISKTLGIRESTIKSQLNRARNLLKDRLKGEYDVD